MHEKTVLEHIDHLVRTQRVVLYMKGDPTFPRCGFSKDVVDVLEHLGVKFISVDVLSDCAIREGIKAYSNWPTIPQLYVDGVLVGGCDIVMAKYRDGSLLKLIQID